ncbi:helix-turn-helix domain-containing protein [[Phormidium] sp. ETS-05]|uniref:helix-turn-helix domain-containing protein n=1 Tax=[Phormidium] sp. ETS-05 TaxID=222819 RepID=UPI0018EF3607|nr:helix-turn-helix domain-containing protein [[Phormidium] sp. ETS-05]
MRPIGTRERQIIQLYSECQLTMTPEQFYQKWDVSYEIMADICWRSPSTVAGWFRRGGSHRHPTANDMRHLALMDLLLECYEDIPPFWRQRLYLE